MTGLTAHLNIACLRTQLNGEAVDVSAQWDNPEVSFEQSNGAGPAAQVWQGRMHPHCAAKWMVLVGLAVAKTAPASRPHSHISVGRSSARHK